MTVESAMPFQLNPPFRLASAELADSDSVHFLNSENEAVPLSPLLSKRTNSMRMDNMPSLLMDEDEPDISDDDTLKLISNSTLNGELNVKRSFSQSLGSLIRRSQTQQLGIFDYAEPPSPLLPFKCQAKRQKTSQHLDKFMSISDI